MTLPVFVWDPDSRPLMPAPPARVRTLRRDHGVTVLAHHIFPIVELQKSPPRDALSLSPTLVGLVVTPKTSTLHLATSDTARVFPIFRLTVDHRSLATIQMRDAPLPGQTRNLPVANHAEVATRIVLALRVVAQLVPVRAVLLIAELSNCSKRLLALLRRELWTSQVKAVQYSAAV